MLLAGVITSLVLIATPAGAEGESTQVPTMAHGIGFGAQTELISPNLGISGALVSYDVGWIQCEASLGLGVFERGANALQDTNVYGLGIRAYVPVHRAARADFSLGGGLAFNLLDDGNGLRTAWTVLIGAKVRIFVVPNVAIVGALGAGVLLTNEGNALIVGARPLGSAGFTYYFK